jgi:putative hemolysin
MFILGLALLGLTLCMSTLGYTLRDYWRSELSERLGREGRERWLKWLERNESELQLLAALVRTVAVAGIFAWTYAWYGWRSGAAGTAAQVLVPALIALLLVLVFGVGIPHALAAHAGETILSHSLWALAGLRAAFWPLTRALLGIEFVIRRLLGRAEQSQGEQSELMAQEILAAVSEGEAHGAVDEDQKEIIESVFRLGETAVSTIMTPRTDIDAVHADATCDQVRELILSRGHSRIPVYEQSVDHIIGVLYAKDLLRLRPGERFDARQLLRIAPYVPETKSINDLLNDFRQTKVQIAIVLDEYGGTAGLVTIEDILEELVGEIDDEYDQKTPPTISRIDDDTVDVDARMRVDELNEELGIELPEEGDYETVGGFVFSTLGKIPAAGEEFRHAGVHFRVLSAEPRKINRLRIRVQREKAETT